MTLNFHYTDSVYIQRLFFIRQEVWKWNFSRNVQFASRFNTAFTIKRGGSQQLKQVISERMGERKKKVIYQQRVGLYSKKLTSFLKKQQFQGLGHSFSLYGPPSWQITDIF